MKIASKLNSLRIKVLLGFNSLKKEKLKLRSNIGTSFDYLLNIKEKINDGVTFVLDDNRYDTNILNWQAGVGFDLNFLTFDIGYTFGLSRVYKDDNVFLVTTNDIKNGGLNFTLGVVFGQNLED